MSATLDMLLEAQRARAVTPEARTLVIEELDEMIYRLHAERRELLRAASERACTAFQRGGRRCGRRAPFRDELGMPICGTHRRARARRIECACGRKVIA